MRLRLIHLRLVIVISILLLVIVAGCSQANNYAPSGQSGLIDQTTTDSEGYASLPARMSDMTVLDPLLMPEQQQPDQPQPNVQQRVVLKNAVLTVVVDDVDSKIQQIATLAEEFGGWVVNEQVSRVRSGDETHVTSAVITVRVDATRLDDALTSIKDGVKTVELESVTGQDVTQDYVDLSSQVANLEAAESQLQEIMSHATRTQDVLEVYNQLVQTRGQIESIRGRLRYYDESAAYSSVQVTVRPTPVVQPVEIGGWRPLETARNAFQALINLLRGAADLVIAVAVFGLPLLIVIGVPLWFVRRRRRAARRQVTPVV